MGSGSTKCPTCGREIQWGTSRFRPFCSERCRLVDLGAWFSGQRSIPGDEAPVQDAGESDGAPDGNNT